MSKGATIKSISAGNHKAMADMKQQQNDERDEAQAKAREAVPVEERKPVLSNKTQVIGNPKVNKVPRGVQMKKAAMERKMARGLIPKKSVKKKAKTKAKPAKKK